MDQEAFKTIYQNEDLSLREAGGRYWLSIGETVYRMDDHPYEPCLYIKGPDRLMVTVHHAFTLYELCRVVQSDGLIRMITGNEYSIRDVFRLIRKAIDLAGESMDISYVEGHCFMDLMKERSALSPETAVDLSGDGLKNPRSMNIFIHSKKVGQTADGRFYLKSTKSDTGKDHDGRYNRVISNQIRFGCGYRAHEGKRQYFAWHGYPNRNDGFFTTAEISEEEFRQIEAEYPEQIIADREIAERFRNHYIDGHPVILEGWNKLL